MTDLAKQADEICRMFPACDHLMAETVLKMHHAGKLQEYIEQMKTEEDKPATSSNTVVGAITVEDAQI